MHQQSSIRRAGAAALAVAMGLAFAPEANARDFFTSIFGGLFNGRPPAASVPLPFASEFGEGAPQPAQPRAARSSRAFCVRTCDGRYFPLTATGGGQSRADACKSFCPASETRVVYGGNIDGAATETGKPYSGLPNAFRYRTELVSGCTCNGKDAGGLAQISIENDPTLRRGDLVAGANGVTAAGRSAERGTMANVSQPVRAEADRVSMTSD